MKRWFGLFATQFLGVFNDNMLKFLAIFTCLNWIGEEYESTIVSLASALLVIPYLLFSPWAGFLAKIKYKKKILVFLKLMEIPIMVIAAIGFYIGFIGFHKISIGILLFSITLMGFQSCIYSPSKYGLIRDVDGEKGINFGTGMMEMLSFVAVLTGTFAASRLAKLDHKLEIFSVALVITAVFGYLTSHLVRAKESTPKKNIEKDINPIKFVRDNFKFSKKIEGLNYVVLGLSFFWVIAALIQMNVVIYVKRVYELGEIATGNAMAAAAIGIGAGCWFSGNISKKIEYSLVLFGGIGLSITSFIIYSTQLSINGFYIAIFFASFFAGVYKIPLNGFIQDKVKGRKLGDIIAYNNLITFMFMIVASGVNILIERMFSSNTIFLLCALLSFAILFVLIAKIPTILPDFFTKIFYILSLLLYRINVEGKENTKALKGTLIVSNHISLLDSVLLVRPMGKYFSFIIDNEFFKFKALRWLFNKTKMIPISPRWRADLLNKFYDQCANVLQQDGNLCIFPEGQLNRIGNLQTFKKGYEEITKKNASPILPIYMDNALGTHFTQPVGKNKASGFSLKARIQRVNIKVGELLPPNTNAFILRQKLKELESDIFTKRFTENSSVIKLLEKNAKRINISFSENDSYSGIKLIDEAKKLARCIYYQVSEEEIVGIQIEDKKREFISYIALMFLNKKILNLNYFNSKEIVEISKHCKFRTYIGDKNLSHLTKIKVESDNQAPTKYIKRETNNITKKSHLMLMYKRIDNKLKAFELTNENALCTIEGIIQQFDIVESDSIYVSDHFSTASSFMLNFVLAFKAGINLNFYQPNNSTIIYTNDKITSGLENFKYVFSKNPEIKGDNIYHFKTFFGLCPIASLNAPDYDGLSAAGSRTKQLAYKKDSYGRAMPGTAIKIVDKNKNELEANQEGFIFIKNNSITDMSRFEGNG
jgi:acyl-[acyl-carrier-protein]-phospholipid O-acyltransferase/long-chain-fatty-acid--[acyl-carrier-protein] ligase